MNEESPTWASWLVAGMALICCGGPFLVAAAGADTIAVLGASLVPYRAHLVGAAGLLLAVGLYTNRVARTPLCGRPGAAGAARGSAPESRFLGWCRSRRPCGVLRDGLGSEVIAGVPVLPDTP
ncbi:MAG TPA: hypothetical protein VMP10_01075 [Chloroflexota bacterium]|nr:hypothetical protein [Chloroflexota bacterium]